KTSAGDAHDARNANAFSLPVTGLPSISSRLSFSAATWYTILPPGPHDGASTVPVVVETFRSRLSATLTAHTDSPPSRVDENAISLSSGDQLGIRFSEGLFVN